MRKKINSKKKGFTLIELIIVIAIIAILSAIAVPNFISLRNKTKNTADVNSCRTIKKAVQVLVADDSIPTTLVADIYTVTYAVAAGVTTITVTPTTVGNVAQAGEIKSSLSNTVKPQGKAMATVNLDSGVTTYPNPVVNAVSYKITVTDSAVLVETD